LVETHCSLEEKKWVTAYKQLPIIGWIEISIILLALAWIIVIHVIASTSVLSVDLNSSNLSFSDAILALDSLQIVFLGLVVLGFLFRLYLFITEISIPLLSRYFNFKEREVIRFAATTTNTIANILAIIAVARDASSTMLFIFFALMFIRELLSFLVDKQLYPSLSRQIAYTLCYAKFYPAERKKLSNLTMTIMFSVMFAFLTGLGIANMILKGIDKGFGGLV
jgi:hypothetical protein